MEVSYCYTKNTHHNKEIVCIYFISQHILIEYQYHSDCLNWIRMTKYVVKLATMPVNRELLRVK